MANPHEIFMEHANQRVLPIAPSLKGVWSRKVPRLLPPGMTDPYPAYICNLMTPRFDANAMNNSPDIDPYSELEYVNEVHSKVSPGEAAALNEIAMKALNETTGAYANGEITACVVRSLWPDRVDDRRGDAIYIIGYKFIVNVYRII